MNQHGQVSDEEYPNSTEYTIDSKRQLWQIGVGRRKSTPKRHFADADTDEVVPESIKRLCYEDEDAERQVRCEACKQKQSEVSHLKREVSTLLRLTEYQQDEIEKLKKDLVLSRRRNDELQRRVIDKMDNLAVIVTNSSQPEPGSVTPPLRESPRPSSPSSPSSQQQLGFAQFTPLSPNAASSSSHVEKIEVDQGDFATRLGIKQDLINRLLEYKNVKTISQFTKDVAVTMFGRETLACHSLTGQLSIAHHRDMNDVKPALPAHRVEALIDFVVDVFTNTARKVIKSCLREKLNDEAKLLKKRLKKEMGENASQVPRSNSRRR